MSIIKTTNPQTDKSARFIPPNRKQNQITENTKHKSPHLNKENHQKEANPRNSAYTNPKTMSHPNSAKTTQNTKPKITSTWEYQIQQVHTRQAKTGQLPKTPNFKTTSPRQEITKSDQTPGNSALYQTQTSHPENQIPNPKNHTSRSNTKTTKKRKQ